MARIVDTAWSSDPWWGLYVWLSAVTGARRGDVVALQWQDIDLSAGVIVLDENYVRGPDGMLLADTKTHQGRRLSLDPETLALLRDYKTACSDQLQQLDMQVTGTTWLFSAKARPQPSTRPEFAHPPLRQDGRGAGYPDQPQRTPALLSY